MLHGQDVVWDPLCAPVSWKHFPTVYRAGVEEGKTNSGQVSNHGQGPQALSRVLGSIHITPDEHSINEQRI